MTNQRSIAVLPFRNISDDTSNEFFCDGITEEIIHALAKIQQLRVISRTSSFIFKNHQQSIKDIGERLNVSIILEGSVRIGGNALRISAQLINVEDDSNFWSKSWDRPMENLFEVQDEISLLIADELREHLGHLDIDDHLMDNHTDNLQAYEHYLKGRFHFARWNPEDTQVAIDWFEQALVIDGNIIDAHVGLADGYSFLAVAGFAPREEAWQKAVVSMDTAKKIDPNHAGLNFMLGNQALFTEANFLSALEYGKKALASVPTHSQSLRFLSFLFTLNGNFKKAKEYIHFAKSIDPLNQETLFFEANYYYSTGELDRANSILIDLLKQNDKNLPALHLSVKTKILRKEFEAAQAQVQAVPQGLLTPDERVGMLCLIDISQGHDQSQHLVELIESANNPSAHHAHSYLFLAFAILGRFDEAYGVLNNLFEHQSSILFLGFSDPLGARIHQEPKYQESHLKIYPEPGSELIRKKAVAPSLDKDTIKAYLAKLNAFMDEDKPYLNPSLTLRLLADSIDIHPNQLSWLLNDQVDKNFNEFINQRRIDHFKKLVVDPSNSHISLIGLAYESGFNSKTVFNTAFKKEVGMTPKAYQKSQVS